MSSTADALHNVETASQVCHYLHWCQPSHPFVVWGKFETQITMTKTQSIPLFKQLISSSSLTYWTHLLGKTLNTANMTMFALEN